MNWTSWDAFVAMGGHGLYVWGSVLVVLGTVAAELALVTFRRQAALRAVRQNLEKRR